MQGMTFIIATKKSTEVAKPKLMRRVTVFALQVKWELGGRPLGN